MAKKRELKSAIEEIKELTALFEKIKSETEELIQRAVVLSETGAEEATELIGAVKRNWEKAVKNFSKNGGLAGLFSSSTKSDSSANSERPEKSEKSAKSSKSSTKKLAKAPSKTKNSKKK